jgi:hypothetical protein
MHATPSRSSQEKQVASNPDARSGVRRIDCAGDDAARYGARPARGGGNRDPQTWDCARDARG